MKKENSPLQRSLSDRALTLQALAGEFASSIRENARQGARLGARLSRLQTVLATKRRQAELAAQAGRGAVTAQAERKELLPFLALSVEAYGLISRHVIACLDDLLAMGERTLGQTLEASPAQPALVQLPRIALVGRPGETVEADFVIQNDFDFPVSFTLCAEAVDGLACADYQLSFSPESASLDPDSHGVVRLRARLAADIRPATYLSQVLIEGLGHPQAGAETKRFLIEVQVAA